MSAPVDRVQVVTSQGTVVEISRAGRDAIVAQLYRADREVGFELPILETVQAFESAGANGPVKLDDRDEAVVIDAIRNLTERTGRESHPEPGVADLHRALVKETRVRWAEEDAQSVGQEPPELSLFYPVRESGTASTARGVVLSLAVGACLLALARRIKPDRSPPPRPR